MAEGWAKSLRGNSFEPHSAGIDPKGINPNALRVMAEVDIDISHQRSQHIDEFKDIPLDLIVTVCGHAHEICPTFPGHTKVMHVGFDDPPTLAEFAQTQEEVLDHYRRVRDEIKAFIKTLPENFIDGGHTHSFLV